jgi:hypothetical protein
MQVRQSMEQDVIFTNYFILKTETQKNYLSNSRLVSSGSPR